MRKTTYLRYRRILKIIKAVLIIIGLILIIIRWQEHLFPSIRLGKPRIQGMIHHHSGGSVYNDSAISITILPLKSAVIFHS